MKKMSDAKEDSFPLNVEKKSHKEQSKKEYE